MNLLERHVAEVEVIRLVLDRHEHQEHPVNELHPLERVDPHVHQDPVQDRHGDELEDGGELDREPGEEEYTDAGDPLLPDQLEHELE